METMTKSAAPKATDRLVEALSTLAALLERTMSEIRTIDSEFQHRLLQSVHDTESSIQKQAGDHLQRALLETEQRIRLQVTDELKANFERDMAAAVQAVRQELGEELEKFNRERNLVAQAKTQWNAERTQLLAQCEQAKQSVTDARAAHQQAERAAATRQTDLERELTATMERIRRELNEERDKFNRERETAAQAKAQYESERAQLLMECAQARHAAAQAHSAQQQAELAAVARQADLERELSATAERVRRELVGERENFNREIDRATQAAAQWEAERARLLTECEQARQAVAESRAAQKHVHPVSTTASQPKGAAPLGRVSEGIQSEIARVEDLVKEISSLIDNPATELSTVIRKNVERAELESYLKGIRFGLNGK